ncbi:hypothetical protein GO011_17235 [Mycobacterium sp. 20091114027_K0903767]|nr:hypothetical protein [Mycobacterium sp. 20091114027_K0903767]
MVEDRSGEWEVWRSPSDIDPMSITLVFDDEYVDYQRRLTEANMSITKLYSLSRIDLAEKITALSADLFFFRIQQESKDGTIPFKQAQRALDSIATMIRAAATTVASPNHSHKGRRPAEVDHFISEDLRLGHTKRGSFVVTAAARFDNDELEPEPKDKASSNGHSSDPIRPFGRRVMTTFSRSLAAAKAVAVDETAVSSAVEQGLSLELAEALERISNEEGLQTIEVSFDWSDAFPAPPDDVPTTVTFDRPILDSLPHVTERLQIREPAKQVKVLGEVVALARNIADEEAAESGEVTVAGEVDGRFRRVLVTLEGAAHEYAIRAYRERFPVIVTGELVKRRSWRLEGFVSMDLEAAELMATRHSHLPNAPSADDQSGELPEAFIDDLLDDEGEASPPG